MDIFYFNHGIIESLSLTHHPALNNLALQSLLGALLPIRIHSIQGYRATDGLWFVGEDGLDTRSDVRGVELMYIGRGREPMLWGV